MFLFNVSAFSQQLQGIDIISDAYYRDDGDDAYFKIKMTLVDKRDNKRERILEIFSKDYEDLLKTHLTFLEPADIENTSFLSWENNDGKDDTQYLYLPALGRSRRIVSSQKKLSFVNTDYTYEDMQRRVPQRDRHEFVGEQSYNGYQCYVVESTPKEKKDSQYSKWISWIDKKSFVVLKVEFYNKKEKKIKELKVEKLKTVSDIVTPIVTVMKDLKQNHTTIMEVIEVKYNQGLDDELFSLRSIEEE